MKVSQKDLLAIVVVLVVLIMSTTREKAKPVPFDDKHRAKTPTEGAMSDWPQAKTW